jgi:hypothetical protein
MIPCFLLRFQNKSDSEYSILVGWSPPSTWSGMGARGIEISTTVTDTCVFVNTTLYPPKSVRLPGNIDASCGTHLDFPTSTQVTCLLRARSFRSWTRSPRWPRLVWRGHNCGLHIETASRLKIWGRGAPGILRRGGSW